MKLLMIMVAALIYLGCVVTDVVKANEGLVAFSILYSVIMAIVSLFFIGAYVEKIAKVKNATRFIGNAEERLRNLKGLVHNFINDTELTEEDRGKTTNELFAARLAEEGLLANGDNPTGSFIGEIGKAMEEINAAKNRRDEALEGMDEMEMGPLGALTKLYAKQAESAKLSANIE